MNTVIVTGLSGSGKSEAMNIFEDIGYYCIDNMPPLLIQKFRELSRNSFEQEKTALGVDIRGYRFFEDFRAMEQFLSEEKGDIKILFLEAREDILVRRYKMSRRSHPLSANQTMLEAIRQEREILLPLREKADYIIDTSDTDIHTLREKILEFCRDKDEKKPFHLIINSFGFKHGIPIDADLVFDVRFLPNPYYVAHLRERTGNEKEVQDYVMNSEVSEEFVERLKDMMDFLIPNYMKEGKTQLVVSIGCTGGRHRSVTVANKLYEYLDTSGYKASIHHRDAAKH
ncbi:MAG: RNase adapter RapZ [Filifactor alocis]|nr:RNase adapter RapZ [Filifactor alocis]